MPVYIENQLSKSWCSSLFEHGPLVMIENKQLHKLNKEKKRRAREKKSQREKGMDVLGVRE